MTAMLRSAELWVSSAGASTTAALLPLVGSSAPLPGVAARLRVKLRRWRDRLARKRPWYGDVAIAGLVTSDFAILVFKHPRVDPSSFRRTLGVGFPAARALSHGSRRAGTWPLSGRDAAALIAMGRAFERVRFYVGERRLPNSSAERKYDEPMPVLIG